MTTAALLRRPSALVPLALSLGAVLAILVHLARFGTAPQVDEGAAARIWQLLMLLQVPAVTYFALRWLPAAPRPALIVLAMQLAVLAGAVAPVALLGW